MDNGLFREDEAVLLILVILGLLILMYILYAPLAELLFKLLHIGTLYKGPSTLRNIALTFDDGPDPRYTPQVLQILREHGARATFFLVGKRAEAHPDLVQAILEDGHELASHGDAHRHAWLLDPISTWLDVARGKRRLEQIAGRTIVYYRPPWGAFNWVTRLACNVLHLKPTLWSLRAIDWLPGEYADEVVQRVVGGAHTGAIVLCHDAGGADKAPLNTIAALPVILEQLAQRGYSFTTVGEMERALHEQSETMKSLYSRYPLLRRWLIVLWRIVEFGFTKLYHIESVNRIFRIAPTTWRFGTRTNDEGEVVVTNGTKALDLHFQNDTLITFSSADDHRALIRGLRMAKEGFQDIAKLLQYDPNYQDVQVAVAITLMNRGIEMLGFHVEDLPETRTKKRLQRYMRFLMGMYHPEGFARLKQGRQALEVKLVWMTRDEIVKLYGSERRR
jgi:peptidoglycan-N-acetylglucosamine deacetylase